MNIKEWLKPKPINWKQALSTLVLMCICVVSGYFAATYVLVGSLPNLHQSKSITSPEMSIATLDEVQLTINELTDREYEEGYNCFNFSWDAVSLLAWEIGQPATIVSIEFEEGPNHAIIIVPTTDNGWIMIEPQANIIVKPHVGGIYDGRKVTAIRVMTTVWTPIDEFIENPVFEEVE